MQQFFTGIFKSPGLVKVAFKPGNKAIKLTGFRSILTWRRPGKSLM